MEAFSFFCCKSVAATVVLDTTLLFSVFKDANIVILSLQKVGRYLVEVESRGWK